MTTTLIKQFALPDALLGSQSTSLRDYTPAQCLMLGALENFFTTLKMALVTQHLPRGARILQEELHWLRANDTRWPMSFINCCKAIDVDPSYIRRGVERYVAQPVQQVERKCPRGNVLPTGIYPNNKCHSRPYRVYYWRHGQKFDKSFATLSEAIAWRNAQKN
jgi:hypothetical protein